jgi:prepilin-type N-terminal cleavage/methylation domain-containing protein
LFTPTDIENEDSLCQTRGQLKERLVETASKALRQGFSLVELLFVMAIVTVMLGLALSAASHWDRGTRMRGAVMNMKSGLGKARQLAMTYNWRVVFSYGNTNALSQSTCAYYVISSTVDGIIGNTNYFPAGVTNCRVGYIEFRSDGTCKEGGDWPEGSSTKDLVLSTLNHGTNMLTATIRVFRVTGFAQLQE